MKRILFFGLAIAAVFAIESGSSSAPKTIKSFTKDPGFPSNVIFCILAIPPRKGLPPFCDKPSKSLHGATPKEYVTCAITQLIDNHPPSDCKTRFPDVDPQNVDPGFPLNSLYCILAKLSKVALPSYCQ